MLYFNTSLVHWFPFRLLSIHIKVETQLEAQFLRLFIFCLAISPHRCEKQRLFQENKNSKASETTQISKFINVKFPLFLMQKLVIIVTSKGLKCIPIPPCKCLMLTLLNVVGKKFNFLSFITSLIRYPITKENNFKFFYCYYVHMQFKIRNMTIVCSVVFAFLVPRFLYTNKILFTNSICNIKMNTIRTLGL